jgi:hypothetical protein
MLSTSARRLQLFFEFCYLYLHIGSLQPIRSLFWQTEHKGSMVGRSGPLYFRCIFSGVTRRLDALDLCAATRDDPSVAGVQVQPKISANGRMTGAARPANSTVLPAEQSAVLRDRLVSEIAGLESQDSAVAWAREALPLKKTLTETDARQGWWKPHSP